MLKQVVAIIPAYNEAARIGAVVTEVKAFVDEVIVIDDGSGDNTAEIARAHGATVITQAENRGYISALKTGFAQVTSRVVVTVDADGEFPAEDIPRLVAPVLAGEVEMTQGRRNIPPRFSEKLLTGMAGWKGRVGDSGTGFRAIETELAQSLQINGACICGVLSLEVLQRGGRIRDIPIELRTVIKPRRIAWFHLRQLYFLLPWMWRKV